jgi:hypothetical protein
MGCGECLESTDMEIEVVCAGHHGNISVIVVDENEKQS